MRSEHRESFRDGNQYVAEGPAPRDARTADRTPIATPAALWLETAESIFKWYGAMVRVAFGLGRLDGRSEEPRVTAPSAPVKPEESSANSAPRSRSNAPATLRPKRRKTSPRGTSRARSSKVSSITRSRRAA
jgi:hypothetical protein